MKTEAGNRLGTEKIGKLMLELALPSVLAQIVNVLYNIVDRIYIGRIPGVGAAALTGVGVTFPIITIISAFAGFTMEAARRWQQLHLDREIKNVRKRFWAILHHCCCSFR